jgi:tetratricopeptide (TPR) repeat protein
MNKYQHFSIAVCALTLSACASQGVKNGGSSFFSGSASNSASAPQVIAPAGDFQSGSDVADVMYAAMLAEMAASRGQLTAALDHFHFAAMRSGDAYFAERTAKIGNYVRDQQKALDGALIWRKAEPENAEANRMVAVLYLRTGQYEQARAELETVLSQTDKKSLGQAFLQIGALFQREVPADQSMDIIKYLVGLYPELPEALFVAASAALAVDDDELALEWVDKALASDPDWGESVTLRGRILLMQKRADEALAYFDTYLQKHPEKSKVRQVYARALVEARKLDEARSQFELLLVKAPNNEEVVFALAMLAIQFKDYGEAEAYLQTLQKSGKRSGQVLYYLGQIAEQRGSDDQAMEWYSQVPEGQYFFDAQLRLASVLARAKSLEEALAHLHDVPVADADEKLERIIFEGDLLRTQGEYQLAVELYDESLEEFAEQIELIYGRALVLERLDQIESALSDLRYIVSIQPDNVAALNALGYTLADRTDRYEEARGFLEKAISMEPNDPAIIDSMGWLHYRMGDLKQALTYLEKAVSLIDDGEVAAHYGEVLWASGEQEKARDVWNKALENFSDNDVLQATVKRFADQ